MSLTKNRPRGSSHSKQDDSNVIYEHIRRIDGAEVTRRYYKCGLLGKGGFANCFITENTDTRQRTATKVVLKEELRTHRTRLRLSNEIKLHKALHHPNVVQLYHCFEDKEHVYIFLELCENQSLNELIKVRGTFLTPEIQSFLYGIVNGLKYIHDQKIIHRDLKLGNIFIDSKLNVKIGDFGLATKLEFSRECKRTVCGTPNYIAPEVLDGRGYHFEVDIWSVGVILYTLYFGVPPFETEDANSTYQRIKDCSYMIPKSNTPPEAVTLIQKILQRNPADRPTLD
jgi:serine/threonine protein kinase